MKIEIKELRIGNYTFNNDGQYLKITEVADIGTVRGQLTEHYSDTRFGYSISEIQPISLSPEILKKAGFERVDVGNEYYEVYKGKRNLYIIKCLTEVKGAFGDKVGEYYMGENHTHIPNLHWLQNYVFFNYKFELEIEL